MNAKLFKDNPGIDAQVFLKMAPGLAAQAFQRLDFVREKHLFHCQFDIQDFQAFFRDHLITEFGGWPFRASRIRAPTWSGWTLMPPTEKMVLVRPATPQARQGAATGAGVGNQGGAVAAPEAYQGEGHGAQGGDHQFPGRAGAAGAPVEGSSIPDRVALPKLEPSVGAAAEGQARPHDLGDAVGRGALHREACLDLPAHLGGERRGHQQARLRLSFRRGQVHAGHHRQRCRARGGVVTRTEVLYLALP